MIGSRPTTSRSDRRSHHNRNKGKRGSARDMDTAMRYQGHILISQISKASIRATTRTELQGQRHIPTPHTQWLRYPSHHPHGMPGRGAGRPYPTQGLHLLHSRPGQGQRSPTCTSIRHPYRTIRGPPTVPGRRIQYPRRLRRHHRGSHDRGGNNKQQCDRAK